MKEELWYILQIKPNSRLKAIRNLEDQGFKTFMPLVCVTKRIGNTFKNEFKPLFPGYLFVSFDPNFDLWTKISNTIGVKRLLFFGEKPQPLPRGLVSALKHREKIVNCSIFNLTAGNKLKILNGPFSELVVRVEAVEENKRIWVLLDFLGRQSRVALQDEDYELI